MARKKTMTRTELIRFMVGTGEYSPAMADIAISHYLHDRISEGTAADLAWELTVEFMILTLGA